MRSCGGKVAYATLRFRARRCFACKNSRDIVAFIIDLWPDNQAVSPQLYARRTLGPSQTSTNRASAAQARVLKSKCTYIQ